MAHPVGPLGLEARLGHVQRGFERTGFELAPVRAWKKLSQGVAAAGEDLEDSRQRSRVADRAVQARPAVEQRAHDVRDVFAREGLMSRDGPAPVVEERADRNQQVGAAAQAARSAKRIMAMIVGGQELPVQLARPAEQASVQGGARLGGVVECDLERVVGRQLPLVGDPVQVAEVVGDQRAGF